MPYLLLPSAREKFWEQNLRLRWSHPGTARVVAALYVQPKGNLMRSLLSGDIVAQSGGSFGAGFVDFVEGAGYSSPFGHAYRQSFLYAGTNIPRYSLWARVGFKGTTGGIFLGTQQGSGAMGIYCTMDSGLFKTGTSRSPANKGVLVGTFPLATATNALSVVATDADTRFAMFLDGALHATGTPQSSNYNATMSNLALIGDYANANPMAAILWDRTLPDFEAQSYSEDPRQLFEILSPNIYFFTAGTSSITGTLSSTLETLPLSASGKVNVNATLASTLQTIALASSGIVRVDGTASNTLETIALASSGSIRVDATLNSTLDTIPLAATGTASSSIDGTLAATLQEISVASQGDIRVDGNLSSTLNTITLASSGEVVVEGTLASTLDTLSLVSSGIVGSIFLGQLAVTLETITLSSQGNVDIEATLSQTLDSISLTSQGLVDIEAQLGVTLNAISLSAQGTNGASPTVAGGSFTWVMA